MNKLEFHSPKDALPVIVPSLVKFDHVVLEKKILNFLNIFSLFRKYHPIEKGGALHLYKLESPSPKDPLC